MKLRIWTLAFAVVLTLSIGLVTPSLLSNKSAQTPIDYEQLKQNTIEDFKVSLTATIEAVELEAQRRMDEEATADASVKTEEDASAEADQPKDDKPKAEEAKDDAPKAEEPKAEQVKAESTETDETELISIEDSQIALSESAVYVKDDWINQKINENKEDINRNDLDIGAAIYNSLDTDYLFSLSDEGLTAEEKVMVDEYLSSQLSGADYEIAKELYYKYVELLRK